MATVSGVVRDHWGRVVIAFHKKLGSYFVLKAKAQALNFGLQLCMVRGLKRSCSGGGFVGSLSLGYCR